MKINSLLILFDNFKIAVSAASGVESTDLKDLRQLFLGHEEESVLTFAKTLIKHRDARGRKAVSSAIARLRETLTALEALLRSASGNKAADDVAKLIELLDGCGQSNVTEFVIEARAWLLEKKSTKAKSESKSKAAAGTSKKNKTPPAETLSPSEYAAALKRTAQDHSQFDQLIARLRADGNVKVPDMREIASIFLGYELAKKKGRKDALEEIIKKQAVEARQDARSSLLDPLKF